MKNRIELNQVIALDEEIFEEMISDLDNREEFLCTGHACALEAEGI